MAYTHNPGRNAFTYPTSHLEVDPVQPTTDDVSLQSQYQQQRTDPYNTDNIQAPSQYGSSHSQSGNSGSGSAAAYYPKSSTYAQAPQYRSKQLQNIAYYRQHNRLPFPNTEKLLGWQNWTIPIPFIPMKRPIPLIFAAVWLILCAYWNGVLAIVGQNRQQLNVRTMPDVGHDIFAYYGTYGTNKIEPHNIYIGIFGALTVIRFLTTRSFFWEIARRFLFVWGCMFILRGATDGLTQETRTTDRCTPSFAIGSDPWTNGWHYVFGGAKTCSDLMFSGHTVAFTLLALQWSNYSTGAEFALCCARPRIPKFIKACFLPSFTATGDVESCWIVPTFFWFVAVGGYILLIADRAHYSVDVFIAAMLTVAIYKLYLFYVKTCYDHDSFLSSFVIWFEGLTPPLPGQAYLSVMECGGYSTKTTAALPPEWTWFDVIEPPVYDQEMIARQYGGPQAGTQVEMGTKPNQYSDDRHPAYASQTTAPTDDIERGHPQIVRPSQERYSNQPFRGAEAVQQQQQYGQQSNEQYHASVPDYQQQSQPTSYTTSNVGSNY